MSTLTLHPPSPDPADSRPCCAIVASLTPPARGSRRRRIWELGGHSHCPVVGVCLPLTLARRLADKMTCGNAPADDYDLHCGLATDCKSRTHLAEAVNRVLDDRHGGAVRLACACKSPETLEAWWRERAVGAALPGALWAVLTHPSCNPRLEHQVLGEVHMRQHQVGHEDRADHARLAALEHERNTLASELATVRARQAQQAAEQSAERQRLLAEAVQLRGQLLARDSDAARLNDELRRLNASASDLPSRRAMADQIQARDKQLVALRRERATARDLPARLRARTVLCVGGRTGAVPQYRRLVEQLGARFEHHDGGPGTGRPPPASQPGRGRPRHLPGRLRESRRLLARERTLQAHRQALRVRR